MRASSAIVWTMFICGVSAMGQAQEPPKPGAIPWGETTAGMVEQLAQDRKEADASLNAVFGKLIAQLDEAGKMKLRMAEKAWIKYRDAQAAFEGSLYEGGSIRPLIEGNCLLAITRNRTKELQEVLDTDFGH